MIKHINPLLNKAHTTFFAFILLMSLSQQAQAQAGAALNFDGNNDYIATPSAFLAGQVQTTLEAWVKPTLRSDGTALNQFPNNVISSDIPGAHGRGFGVTVTSSASGISVEYHNGFRYINYSFTSNTWYHVAVVYTSSNVSTYVNGVIVDNFNVANSATNAILYIGRHNTDGAYGTKRFFYGSIDEVRIWNVARTCDQISQQYACELAGNETGLLAYYKFNQGTADGDNTALTSLTDATANGYNGTFNSFTLNGSTSNFIATGGVTTGVSCSAVVAPEINLKGNTVSISSGTTATSTSNHTDFGNIAVNGSFARTFTIENTGVAALTVSNITSSNAKFVVSNIPPSVSAGGTATFTVTFNPTATGAQTATITVSNSDCDEASYTFVVSGTGVAVGAALSFDGVNDYIEAANEANFDLTTATLEMWVKPNSFSGYRKCLTKRMNGGNNTWTLGFSNSNVHLETQIGSLISSATVATNTWTHIAGVIENLGASTALRIYINGTLVSSQTFSGTVLMNNSPFSIGSLNGSEFFDGQMDEVRVWNTARTCDQISQLRNCELVGNESGLVAYYKFNQGAAASDNTTLTSLTDATANGNNGTFVGFALNGSSSNFVATGGVTTGVSCGAVVASEINLKGNTVSIASGTTATSTTNHTDFGTIASGGSFARTFTIENTGTGILTISSITSSNAKFVVSNIPPSVSAGGTATFTVTFNPTATGAQTATITVSNSDCDEGTYTFAVTGTGATAGAALNFDGVADYVITPNNTTLDLSVQTVELWAKPSGSGDNDLLVGKRNYNATNPGVRWSIHFKNGNEGLYFYSPAGYAIWSYAFTPNQWYHIAMVTDANSTKLYINGTFISSQATTINPITNLPVIFGASGPNFEVFSGNLDEVRIWNTARTCDQISQLRNCELVGNESGLVAYYKFNQGAAASDNTTLTSLTDATANGNNGTFVGFALNGSSSNFVATGGVTTGVSCGAVTAPEINLKGNNFSIASGTTATSTLNHTDFGTVASGGSFAKTFTIENTGVDVLTISSITSSNARFVVSNVPPSVSASGTATFTVTFNPTAIGAQTATITVNNSDCDEGTYTFAVSGTGTTQYTFNGTTNTDWATASNWSNNAVPTSLSSGDQVVIAANCTMSGIVISFPSGTSLTINNGIALNLGTTSGITIASGATLTLNASASISQGFINNTGTMDIYGNYTAFYMTNNSGGVMNVKSGGSYTCSDCAQAFNSGSTINNDGTLNFPSGSSNAGTINNNLGGVISSGAQLSSSGTIVNAGTFTSRSSSTTGSFTNSGTFNVGNSSELFTVGNGGSFTNTGTVTVPTGNFFNINAGGSMTNSSTGIVTNNGTMTVNGTYTNNGTYKGTGTYTGSLFTNQSSGIVAPGNSAGCMTFSNGLTNNGTLQIEVGGITACSQSDKITVTGTATLGGTLSLSYINGYTGSGSQTVTTIDATTLSGTFASVTGLPSNWFINYNQPSVGKFTLSYNAVLSVELLNFKGQNIEVRNPVTGGTEGGNVLTWATAHEQDIHQFEVERSPNGVSFQKIGEVKAKGSNTTYTFFDAHTAPQTYYRLKMVDVVTNKVDYSKVISVESKGSTKVKVYPSVTTGELTIEGAKSFDIYNAVGQVVMSMQGSGNFQSFPNLTNHSAGIYFVKGIDTEGRYFTQKIIKQ